MEPYFSDLLKFGKMEKWKKWKRRLDNVYNISVAFIDLSKASS